jgi:hypothetical protein
MGHLLQQWEPTGWAEELLDAATAADLPLLPRLYTAAAYGLFAGRQEAAVSYARRAVTLQHDQRYVPFRRGWSNMIEVVALLYTGRIDLAVERNQEMIDQRRVEPVFTLAMWPWVLTDAGRDTEARAIAEEAIATARADGNPYWIAASMIASARAFIQTEPEQALSRMRQALDHARQHRLIYAEAVIARDAAGLEALHGSRDSGLELFDTTIDAFHRSSSPVNLARTLASLGVFFDRINYPNVAATLYGGASRSTAVAAVPGLATAVEHLQAILGVAAFDRQVAAGEAMDAGDAVAYAREQIRLAQQSAIAGREA